MKKIKKFKFTVTFIVFCALYSVSCILYPVFLNAAFQENTWGTRPMGMGGAFVAVADDADAVAWNPAGLGRLFKTEASFMYSKLYYGIPGIDMGKMYFSGVYPMKDMGGTAGGAYTSYYSGTEYEENSFIGAYGGKIYAEKVSVIYAGVAARYLKHTYKWDQSTIERAIIQNDPLPQTGNSVSGVGVDAGVLAVLGAQLSIGATGRNLVQPNLGLILPDKVPMEYAVGMNYKIDSSIMIAADVNHRAQEWGDSAAMTSIHVGGEYWTKEKNFAIRGGYDTLRGPTAGLSVYTKVGTGMTARIDYAIVMSKLPEDKGSHRVSVNIAMGEVEEEKLSKKAEFVVNVKQQYFSPNGDNEKDVTELSLMPTSYVLTNWQLIIKKEENVLLKITGENQFPEKVTWNGKDEQGNIVVAGEYKIQIKGKNLRGRTEESELETVTVDNTLPKAELIASQLMFTPDGDGANDTVSFNLVASDDIGIDNWLFKIVDENNKVVRSYNGTGSPPQIEWDGKDDYYQKVVPLGKYTLRLVVYDVAGNKKSVENMVKVSTAEKIKEVTKETVPSVPKQLPLGMRMKTVPEGTRIIVSNSVLFEKGKALLSASATPILEETMKILEKYPANKIKVEAHTNSVGDESYNKLLTDLRARKLYEYFVSKGIDGERLDCVGYGETKPLVSNETVIGRDTNERVELFILK